MKLCVCVLSRNQLFVVPWTVACQAPPSMGFSRQEHWSGLPFPSPGDLPNPGIKLTSLALQAHEAELQIGARWSQRCRDRTHILALPLSNSVTLGKWLGLLSLSSLSCKMRHFVGLLAEYVV